MKLIDSYDYFRGIVFRGALLYFIYFIYFDFSDIVAIGRMLIVVSLAVLISSVCPKCGYSVFNWQQNWLGIFFSLKLPCERCREKEATRKETELEGDDVEFRK